MAVKHTLEELNNLSREEMITMVLMMQGTFGTKFFALFSL